jgi:hypothetical protein
VNISTTGGSAVTCDTELTNGSVILDNGASTTYTLTCPAATEGSKFKGDIRVRWKKTTETVVHSASGSLSVSVEE